MTEYVYALVREMEACAPKARDVCFDTVFFGGGTPTLLPSEGFALLLDKAKALFDLAPHAEITAEANPATATADKLSSLRRLGINRLSVGVQSMLDGELCALGRIHSASEARTFLSDARAAGFDNVNVDLMYGIPHQTVESAKQTLDAVLSFAPEHVSAYSLIVEEGTPFFERRDSLALPDEEVEEAIDTLVKGTLREQGYQHYEISNYAVKGYECRHNLHYWKNDPYLGFGAAAYSCFDGVRYGNGRDLCAYLRAPGENRDEQTVLTEDDLAYEWIMLRLRLAEGLDTRAWSCRFGKDFNALYHDALARFEKEGLLARKDSFVFLTERGMLLSNTVLLAFLQN